ncbi:MAG: alpha/beta fold hydrolase [Clostridia bacterium]|nr:alpha/beta fold hydrolase [Clostridia bacterium]
MNTIDNQIEQLLKYQGSTPKPDDFDEYWARALKELDATAPEVQLKPAKFQVDCADCFDLYFTGVGGSRIYAKYLRPKKSDAPHPALLMFHGYSANSGNWNEKLAYVAAGFSVFAMDVRGQGGLSQDLTNPNGPTLSLHVMKGIEDHEDTLFYRNVYLDTVQLARVAASMPEVDGERLGVMGGSQGGGLSLACAALANIKRAAVTYPFLCDFVWGYRNHPASSNWELREYFRRHDPRNLTEKEVFRKLGYIDCQHLADRITAEVLMHTGLEDNICPPMTQFAMYNKLKCKKSFMTYPNYTHEWIPDSDDYNFMFLTQL